MSAAKARPSESALGVWYNPTTWFDDEPKKKTAPANTVTDVAFYGSAPGLNEYKQAFGPMLPDPRPRFDPVALGNILGGDLKKKVDAAPTDSDKMAAVLAHIKTTVGAELAKTGAVPSEVLAKAFRDYGSGLASITVKQASGSEIKVNWWDVVRPTSELNITFLPKDDVGSWPAIVAELSPRSSDIVAFVTALPEFRSGAALTPQQLERVARSVGDRFKIYVHAKSPVSLQQGAAPQEIVYVPAGTGSATTGAKQTKQAAAKTTSKTTSKTAVKAPTKTKTPWYKTKLGIAAIVVGAAGAGYATYKIVKK